MAKKSNNDLFTQRKKNKSKNFLVKLFIYLFINRFREHIKQQL